jgi:hypothetical protein
MKAHIDVMKKALAILNDRGKTYDAGGNGMEQNFTRAADIAALWIGKPITARDVAMIMASVKMARIAAQPGHEDSFIDLVNYVAFAAAFSTPPGIANGQFNEKKFDADMAEAVGAGVV